MSAAAARPSPVRLVAWTVFVGLIAAINYYARFTGTRSSGSGAHQEIYSWTQFAGGMILYAIWFGFVLLMAIDRFDLLALRRPASWPKALGLAGMAVVGIWIVEGIVAVVPLPESPGREQGITTTHWEPKHAAAFAANVVLFAVVAPFVEELTFRGVGQSLLRYFVGRAPSIVLVGFAFGLAHGLLEALLVLVPFGILLAWLRDRTESVLPGMLVHALFNGVALAAAVL